MDERKPPMEKKELDIFYNDSLRAFDVATCEAVAVSQSIGVRMSDAHIGHSTYVFARLCNHAISMICASPRSRWVRADFSHWDFGGVAAHGRAIIEGFLLLSYLIEAPGSQLEWSAKINVIFLNDCTRRIKMLTNAGVIEDVKDLEVQAEELRARLSSNEWFGQLPSAVRKRCLSGDNLMIANRDEMLIKVGWEKNDFYAIWDLLSQYVHVLPISFIRMEPNGRGTGLENDTDKGYTAQLLRWGAETLVSATALMAEVFPHTKKSQQGLKSKFDPGPRSNRRLRSSR
jgi:hypothetical protein